MTKQKSPPKIQNRDQNSLAQNSIEGELVDNDQTTRAVISGALFAGPLPHPDEFNKYPPEVQRAIVRDAKTQMKHRQNIENKVVESDTYIVKVGAIGTIAVFLVTILGAIFLLYNGRTVEGLIVAGLGTIARSLVLFRSFDPPSVKQKPDNKKEKQSSQ